jgi:hypothetical protein
MRIMVFDWRNGPKLLGAAFDSGPDPEGIESE